MIDSTNKYLMSVELPEIFGKYTGEENFILFGVKKHKSLFKVILKLYCSSTLLKPIIKIILLPIIALKVSPN